jgi:uncharacterized protein (DUF697 family)
MKNLIFEVKGQLSKEYLEIETNTLLSREEKINQLIHLTSAFCAGVAIQPIPFADLVLLIPIQGFMGYKIAKIYGINLTEESANRKVKEIFKLVGLSFAARQTAIGLGKIFLPFLGGLVAFPLIYGLTYAMGQIMDTVFQLESKGQEMDPKKVKKLWTEFLKKGKDIGKSKIPVPRSKKSKKKSKKKRSKKKT